MKTGIGTNVYLDPYGYDEGLLRLKAHGYDCVDYNSKREPNFVEQESVLFTLTETELERKMQEEHRAFSNAGLYVNQIHGPWRYPVRDGTKEDRAELFGLMERSVRGAAYLGAPNMVVHPLMPFGPHSDAEPETQWEMNLEFMSRLAEVGREYGVTVCFENMPFRELPLSPLCEILRMVKAVNSEYFRVCLDTGHCNVLGDSPAAAVRLLGREYLRVMHIHDNKGDRDHHLLPGEGSIDFADFSAALREIGYEGALVFETGVSRFPREGEDREARERALAQFLKTM